MDIMKGRGFYEIVWSTVKKMASSRQVVGLLDQIICRISSVKVIILILLIFSSRKVAKSAGRKVYGQARG